MAGAAFFDVDGTLAATSSATSLVWLRARQTSPWRHRWWLANLGWRAPLVFAADRCSRRLADRLVFAQFAGLDHARLRADGAEFVRTVLVPACFPEALAAIAAHRAAGRRVVLLSGGLDLLVEPLAAALGAESIAQRLEQHAGTCTGRHLGFALLDGLPTPASQAAAKGLALARFAALHGVDLAASSAFGDSVNDVAMLAAVGSPAVVNPGGRLARLARARGWPIHRWRSASARR